MKKSNLKFVIDSGSFLLMLSTISTGFIIRYTLPPGSGGHGRGRALNLWGMNRHDWGDVHFWLATLLIGIIIIHLILDWSWVCGVVRGWLRSDRGVSGKVSRGTLMTSGVGFFLLCIVLVGGFVWLSGSSIVATTPRDGETHQELRAESNRQEMRVSELSLEKKTDQLQELVDLGEKNSHKVQSGDCGQGKEDYSKHKSEGLGENDCEDIRGYMTLKDVAKSVAVPVGKIKSLIGLPSNVSQGERLGQLRRRYGFQLDEVRKLIANFKSGKTNVPASNVRQ